MDYNHVGYHTRYALEQYDNYNPDKQIVVSFKQKFMPGADNKLDDPASVEWDQVDYILYGVEVGHRKCPQIHHPNDLVIPLNEITIDYSKFFGLFDKQQYLSKHSSDGGFTRQHLVKCINEDCVSIRDAMNEFPDRMEEGNWTFQHDPYFDVYGVMQDLTDKHVFYLSYVIPLMYLRECNIMNKYEQRRLSYRMSENEQWRRFHKKKC